MILDDFCLTPLDATETSDLYDLVVERHRRASTIVTSNRDPSEWLAVMADALLAQSAIDRLKSAAYELVDRGAVLPRAREAHARIGAGETTTTVGVEAANLTERSGP